MFYEYYRLREVAEGEDVLYGHHFVASVERAGDKSGCHVERIYYPPRMPSSLIQRWLLLHGDGWSSSYSMITPPCHECSSAMYVEEDVGRTHLVVICLDGCGESVTIRIEVCEFLLHVL